jgi:hypothetical protein
MQKKNSRLNESFGQAFAVPENYFSGLDEKILSVIKSESVEAELETATQLKTLHTKESPFYVPYGYFEKLPEKILERVSQKEKTTVVRSIREYFQYSFRVSDLLTALPIAAILVITLLLFKPESNTPVSTNTIALSSEEIQDYLKANISSLEEQTIADQIPNGKSFAGLSDLDLDPDDPSLIDLSQIDLSIIQNL